MPKSMYTDILSAPRLLPKTAPVHRTANVCPVIGTGVPGNFIAICAKMAVKRANPTINAESTNIPLRSNTASAKVVVLEIDCICTGKPLLMN